MENYQCPWTGMALASVGHRDASEGAKASTPQPKQPAESRPEIPQSLLCLGFFINGLLRKSKIGAKVPEGPELEQGQAEDSFCSSPVVHRSKRSFLRHK